MRILFFGTFDERTHPRVRVLREGLAEHGHDVTLRNRPLGLSTAARVQLARQPWRIPVLVARLAAAWVRLLLSSRGLHPDVVVVGYLGHFDVHLARRRFPRATLVLDHMVGLGDTVRDRQAGSSRVTRVLDAIDRAALRAADVVVVDTEEQATQVTGNARGDVVVVPVGAPRAWADARGDLAAPGGPLAIVFFGLYTPLQGAAVIGTALRLASGEALTCTMIGTGQDLEATRAAVGDDTRVTWVDWVDERELPAVVARHQVCLGIFGEGPKAQRVVPNKVFQGAAAGCAIVTSDTAPQRRALGDAARFVPPGDAAALARTLQALAADPDEVQRRRAACADLADRAFTPAAVVRPLLRNLQACA